jgi:hypothetical protein
MAELENIGAAKRVSQNIAGLWSIDCRAASWHASSVLGLASARYWAPCAFGWLHADTARTW